MCPLLRFLNDILDQILVQFYRGIRLQKHRTRSKSSVEDKPGRIVPQLHVSRRAQTRLRLNYWIVMNLPSKQRHVDISTVFSTLRRSKDQNDNKILSFKENPFECTKNHPNRSSRTDSTSISQNYDFQFYFCFEIFKKA